MGGRTGSTGARPGGQPAPRRRLAREARERQIIDGAIRFFAEHGLTGNTRELAERLEITQPLLYKYFPTKNDLIERVFQEIFFQRFDQGWTSLIGDRTRPLGDRLKQFYRHYAGATYTYEWIRLYLFAGLAGRDINARYIGHVERNVLEPICNEIRAFCGLPDRSVIPISRAELDHTWVFHGGLFYYAMRKHIYRAQITGDFETLIDRSVTAMLEGQLRVTERAIAEAAPSSRSVA